jgi:hypothetical protein
LDGERLDVTAQSQLGYARGRNWRVHDLDFQKKFKFLAEKYEIPKKRLTMTKKAELYSRRREMYQLYIAKLNMSDILEKLSGKYRVSKRALYVDWQKRTEWVYDVFDLEPAHST